MTLGQRIREVVGPCTTDSGRGETWMYVGKNRGTASRNKALIAKLQRVFETYKMVRNCKYGRDSWIATDYHFIIRSKTGKFLGMANVSADYSKGSYLIIRTTNRMSLEEAHKYNSSYDEVVFYEKIAGPNGLSP